MKFGQDLEREINYFAHSHCEDWYKETLKQDVDDMLYQIKFDKRLNGDDLDSLREDLNNVLYNYGIDELPKDYPLEKAKDYIVEERAKNYSFNEWISDFWDYITEKYYESFDDLFYENLDKIEDTIHRYMSEHDNIVYEEENSHSWNKGRFPSVYFLFYKLNDDNEKDYDSEITLRISDGHDNGRSHDYKIIFDEYEKSDLIDILDEIVFDLE